MLRVTGLTKRFGNLVALDDVAFEVARGEIVGFLGPNGAGKTTTMRAIMRLLTLDGGDVTWDGVPIDADIRRRFGYMPAERGMYPRMRVLDHLVYYARLSGHRDGPARAAAMEWLDRLGLAERAGDAIQSLSSGNQQRVQLALALMNEPEALILDEPFAGLDPVAVGTLEQVLHEQVANGVALLLSSHQLDLVADVCRSVVIVDHGRVVLRGDVADLRSASRLRYVEVEFGAPVDWGSARAQFTSEDGRRYRAAVPSDIDVDALITEARAAGPVVAYSFAPPDLSEVFRSAVGGPRDVRPTTEEVRV